MGSVADVSKSFVESMARLHPIWGLHTGIVDRSSPASLTDFSPAGAGARKDLLDATLRELAAADAPDEKQRLGRVFLSCQLSGALAITVAGEEESNVSALSGPQAVVRQCFDLLPKGSDEDWAGVLDRMVLVPETLDGYREMLRKGMTEGRVASRRCVDAVVRQCRTWAGGAGGSGGSAGSGGWFSSMVAGYDGGALAEQLERAAAGADQAYGSLAGWLADDYKPSERDGVGEERYRLWARNYLGAELDAEDAYRWGWEELARIEAEKAAEADRIQPGASYREVVETLGRDRSRGIEGVDAWKSWLQELTDRTTEFLNGVHFDIAEELRRCEVGIPPEGTAAAPHYTPPAEDFTRPGRIWFPTTGRSWFTTWDLPSIVFHEAVPGHHLQVGGLRLADLTRAQQVMFNSAHGEGWALYAERFMDEIGGFEKPEYRLGFLSMQAFRAARVVVDIGLHTGRRIPDDWPGAGSGQAWSFDLAVDFIQAASGQNREMCVSEVERYLSVPGQATCYKLGERSWLTGRELASRAAGPSFDLKRWHSDALALGPLGLEDLERELATLAGA